MKMPTGKFKGQELCDLPSSYLKRVAENWKERTQLDRDICCQADQEWRYREKHGCHVEE